MSGKKFIAPQFCACKVQGEIKKRIITIDKRQDLSIRTGFNMKIYFYVNYGFFVLPVSILVNCFGGSQTRLLKRQPALVGLFVTPRSFGSTPMVVDLLHPFPKAFGRDRITTIPSPLTDYMNTYEMKKEGLIIQSFLFMNVFI